MVFELKKKVNRLLQARRYFPTAAARMRRSTNSHF